MNALQVEHLSKTYKGGVEALKNVSLEVKEGDFFALLGPNGAGKTTLIGIVSTLVTKNRGSVQVFGHDLDKDMRGLKAQLGVVPQEFNFNIFEKVLQIVLNQAGYYGIAKHKALENAEHYLRKLELWDKRDTQAMRLSGGMKRRLMIARALVHNPRLLILDELRRSMWDFILELNANGTTIILTTHYLEEAENLCKNIAIIDEGEIIENTSMQSLLNRLDSQTLVLDLQHEVTSLPGLTGFKARLLDRQILEVTIGREQSINQFFTHLNEAGISVSNMRNKTNRLEELFIRLVDKEQRIR